MIDLILFAGRVLLVVLLYIFLFSVMRTGIGLVRGQRKDGAIWSVDVEKGVKSLHARFTIQGPALVLEDLGSTNGTMVNGHIIEQPVTLRDTDEVQVGDVIMRVGRR